MRLSCPTCEAEYEVPDQVIPKIGRDVQCSACGDTWFQVHPDHPEYAPAFDPEAPEDETDQAFEEEQIDERLSAQDPAEKDETDGEVERAETAMSGSAIEEPDLSALEDVAEDIAEQETPTDEIAEDEGPISTPPRQELSEDVTNVLREEADRETRAREADMAGGLETQPDLGLTEDEDVERRTAQAKARMARLRGFDDAQDEKVSDLVQQPDPGLQDAGPDIDMGTRANLLPEVEEVDQKLEAETDEAVEAAAARDGSRVATQKKRGGFGRGMRVSISLFVIAAGLYIMAPQVVGMVPALSDPLMSYTQLVDQGRAALQGLISQQ